jgi:type IV pilus assembly protein PilN
MRVNINLASQKYEDVRTFVARARAATAALCVFTLVLLGLAWLNYSSSKNSSGRIRELQQKINVLEQQRANAIAVENMPENRDVTDQKNYWNRQIARRALSWTQLFNDLQKIMPGRVYVISVAPELTPDNQLKLKLTIGGEKQEDLNTLVKRMEDSRKFVQPQITAENVQKDARHGAPPLHKFEIETLYMPAAPGRQAAAREGL